MPIYQYACTECGEQLEVRQSFTDEPLTDCPSCQGRLRKVLSAVGVVFKGSGFYRTDSRKEPAGSAASDSGGTSTDTSGSAAREGAAQNGAAKNGAAKNRAPTSTAATSGGASPSGASSTSTASASSG